MKQQPANPPAHYRVSQEILMSFAAPPRWCWLSGHGGLVRFLQEQKTTSDGQDLEASRLAGMFWFDEILFSSTRAQAKSELHAQFPKGPPQGTTLRSLTGLFMRLCLRQDLAICKNWTQDFDGYAVLPLRPQDALLALVGPIREQPYYSKLRKRDKRHALAESKNIRLPGGAEQFVVDFSLKENRAHEGRIMGPFPF
ncbi:hypothetical protein [Prosthecobacter sp.]|uniref:hypothetical protein n=1 Tax=Prosthecobacter sp. TaxID=1965333 RepID=UPI003783C428